MHPATKQSDIQRLQNRVMTLATDRQCFEEHITELEAEIARLRAELAATMLPYQGHTVKIIGGVATIFMHGGDVWERRLVAVDRPNEGGYEWRFVKVESIPGSPAARIDAVAPALCEMGCVGERLERVS
jgi:hypothetical protein